MLFCSFVTGFPESGGSRADPSKPVRCSYESRMGKRSESATEMLSRRGDSILILVSRQHFFPVFLRSLLRDPLEQVDKIAGSDDRESGMRSKVLVRREACSFCVALRLVGRRRYRRLPARTNFRSSNERNGDFAANEADMAKVDFARAFPYIGRQRLARSGEGTGKIGGTSA